VVLSWFDGIATGPWVLQQLFGPLRKVIAWEIDPEALLVAQHHVPDIVCRGDFLDDEPQDVAQTVRDFNTDGQVRVVFLGAPPCPDFSTIKGDDAPGSHGQEGQKFLKFAKFAREVEDLLHPIPVGYLVENVILQDRGEIDFFSSSLDCQAVVVDSADYQVVSRPRLWWSRIPWTSQTHHPFTNQPLQWSKNQKLYRLHVGEPPQDLTTIQTDGLSFHPALVTRQKILPCFTTPAPSESGRPAPKKLKGRIDPATKARWLADQRTFAPWQYSPEAMMQLENGSMVIPPADVKEQCHHLPKGYTQVQGVSERSRHRLLANGWHAGVARFMLYMVVMTLQARPLSAIPCQPRTSTLQWVVQQLARFPPRVGPGGWPMQPNSIPPADDMWQHWDYSSRPVHPLQQPPMLPPGMQQTIQLQSLWRSDLHRIRHEVVEEISQMIMDSTEDTLSWWQTLPDHIRQVYYDPTHKQITQIPIFLKLLKMAGYPGLDDLTTDLLHGFEVLGELHPGCGWNPRHDERYNYPISFEAFSKMNRNYVLDKLRKNFVDPHWKTMFEELLEERTKGRLSGPFKAPSWWTRSTRSVNGEPLLELPEGDVAIAFCFSVSQTDKTRRCEDLRRSGHNSTVLVRDVPHHDDLDVFLRVAHTYSIYGSRSHAWSQDLAGAYRQFPIRNPNHCFVAINTPEGTVLFRHHAMAFGAVGSVWGFNRCGDALSFLAQRLLFCMVGHYVDDFI